MFRRAFWFTTGAAAGVWATTKVQRTLRGLAPESLALRAADRAVAAGQRVRGFAIDVRAGMAQRERELTEALGIEADETAVPGRVPHPAQLPSRPHRAELDPVTRDTSRISEMRTTDGVG